MKSYNRLNTISSVRQYKMYVFYESIEHEYVCTAYQLKGVYHLKGDVVSIVMLAKFHKYIS